MIFKILLHAYLKNQEGKVMTVEKVSVNDANELLSIYAPYILNTAISFEHTVPSAEEFAQRIANISSKYPYIKAVENGEIIGYAYANTFKARKSYEWSVETTIYIKESCRNSGVGKLLYTVLEKSLHQMGILNMNACITLAKKESPYYTDASPEFHKKLGFKQVGKFHNIGCKFGEWFDMIWMEKHIGIHKKNPRPVKLGNWDIII